MKSAISTLLITIVLWSCSNNKKEAQVEEKNEVKIDSTLITDSSWGAITQATDFGELKKIYGAENVKNERICGAECVDSVDVTIIYPGDKREVIVYWLDTFYLKKIAFLQSGMPDAPYHTSTGLKMGSTLTDLLRINGQKINFSGFGWDYGGYVQSYNGGTLDRSPVQFRLDLMEDSGNDLLGDVELNTDMESVKKVMDKIRVWQISFVPGKKE